MRGGGRVRGCGSGARAGDLRGFFRADYGSWWLAGGATDDGYWRARWVTRGDGEVGDFVRVLKQGHGGGYPNGEIR
jgi:hypothetical protein